MLAKTAKTTLIILAAALLGLISPASAAPKHHASAVQKLRAAAYAQDLYAQDLRLYSGQAARTTTELFFQNWA